MQFKFLPGFTQSFFRARLTGGLLCLASLTVAQDRLPNPRVIGTPCEKVTEQSLSKQTERALKLYRQGDVSGASKLLAKAEHWDRSAWIYLSLARLRANELAGAVQAFERAEHALPTLCETASAWDWLAQQEAKRTLATKPQDAEAHYVLGMVKLRSSAPAEAQTHAEAALRAAPDFLLALLLQSEAMLITRAGAQAETACFAQYKAAAAALERALKLAPTALDREEFRQRLETLRFYAQLGERPADGQAIYCFGSQLRPNILTQEKARFTEVARQERRAGRVQLLAVFGADGQLHHLLPLRMLPDGLTESALQAASKIRFTPAIRAARPVAVVGKLEYAFQMF
jgi:tetratricopeptide (TPR) repeat protein